MQDFAHKVAYKDEESTYGLNVGTKPPNRLKLYISRAFLFIFWFGKPRAFTCAMTSALNTHETRKPVTTNQSAALRLTAAWMPAMLGVLVICGESTRVMGADHTMVWLSRLCMPLIHLANADMVELNHILRKCGHFFGYGTLGLIFAQGWLAFLLARSRSAWAHLDWAQTRLRAAGLAVLCTAAVASMDEIHQSFLPNRTACVSDVLLDTLGAVLMLTLVATVLLLRRRRTLQDGFTPACSTSGRLEPCSFGRRCSTEY